MNLFVIPIAIISGVSALLAAALIFAERVISNYGEVMLNINDKEKEFTVRGGASLLETLTDQKIFIPSACGGRGTCGYCKVKVTDGAGPLLPTEEPYMNAEERTAGIRLSCQVKLRNDLKIEIPAELLSIRQYVSTCEKIVDYTYDIKQFRLTIPERQEMKYTPGQYVQVLAPQYEKSAEEVYRAYSISSDPADKKAIELIVRRVPDGICTTYLFDYLKEGQSLNINGPYGHFYLRETTVPIIFIAGGSGIAPIKCILHHMQNMQNPRKAIFFFGVRTTRDLFLVEEMKGFESGLPDFKFIPVLSQPEPDANWRGATGWVTTAAEEYLKNQTEARTYEGYLCGSPGMIESSIKVLTGFGIPDDKIYYDKFS
ncbi:MAG: 2Fe-2S iron-sulfur cluster binding domain-containing protein [candidate division WOR-3 bacterium]|nr:MAG: 2Fe-2S iron-sulfur cluster binding domain-containing protein [candidate division WOR-3 bacterium]